MNGINRPGWGPWHLNVSAFTLEHDDYEVDLEQCTSSAEVLDWIVQVASKNGATDTVVAGLVRAINDVVSPQENLCSHGKGATLTSKQVRQLVRGMTP